MVIKFHGGLVTAIPDVLPLAAQPPFSELQNPVLMIQTRHYNSSLPSFDYTE